MEQTEKERDAVRELEVLRQRDSSRLQASLHQAKVHVDRVADCSIRIASTQHSIAEQIVQNNTIVNRIFNRDFFYVKLFLLF